MHQPGRQIQPASNGSEESSPLPLQGTGVYQLAGGRLLEERCTAVVNADEANKYATQYYTVEIQSREGSPTLNTGSPSGSETPASSVTASTSSEPSELPIGVASGVQQSLCVQSSATSQSLDSSTGGATVKHWTYEEQFKQLYNLSPEAERKEFLDKLFDYMQKKGTPITRVPIMAKQPLDLYKLFKLVVERGGLVEVIKKKAWRNVAKELNLPASITSAAFTMRSQYMKYLYPYECEVEKLSDPQELQMAIDSNKRDRRHSETVDFMSPQIATCRAELEQTSVGVNVASPVAHAVTSTQGLQLISSPTVALPHGSISPYGGFIMTSGPGGTHVMAPHIQPQLVHMAGPHSAIPIVVPASAENKGLAEEDEDLESEPPTKKLGLDLGHHKFSAPNRIGVGTPTPHSGGVIVTMPGGTHVVQTASPQQLFQMAGHPQMQPAASGSPTERRNEEETKQSQRKAESLARKLMQLTSQTPNMKVKNGLPIATFPSQSLSGGMVLAPQGLSASHLGTPHLVQVPAHSPIPIMIPAGQGLSQGSATAASVREDRDSSSNREEVSEMGKNERERPSVASTRIPFANISIQSAGSKDGSEGSILVTMDLNNVVYQGVLFAKPGSIMTNSPTR